ncbi:hypothetical protein RD792_011586 [Penstemon davidsonii]|uniref:Uncharacterized protein n=1 Tax=Penstemon davidsonii TaxID=160366 RepID=A0ABR0CYD3_9LAMI|nr:hypothetical protein RD792_011586 [Penstemon davidsonii]
MAEDGITMGESSQRLNGLKRAREEGMRYTRYTEEQIEVLEKVYAQCSNPNRFQRAQIMSEQPLLKDVDNKQLKIWFQNRRSREKQKKENSELVAENKNLDVANKLLRDENDRLQKQSMASKLGRVPEVNTSDAPVRVNADNNRLILLAEEAKNEIIAKVFGTVINWISIPNLKLPTSISVSDVSIASTCPGIAAKAISIVPFEPIKTIEILKDKQSWSRDCKKMEVFDKFPTKNGGTIELIKTQCYAPTTMACARDFFTLRYTSILEDNTFVLCEKSISDPDAISSSTTALEFVRAKILGSGYLIRPCEGGSTIHIVEHLDLEASSVPDVVRLLYESPELLTKKNIVHALQYIDHLEKVKNEIPPTCFGKPELSFLRRNGRRLSRGFNDATNGFTKDGWTLMNVDASDDVILSVKRTTNGLDPKYTNVICVKTSLIIQNVSPARLVKLLGERRADWLSFNVGDGSPGVSQATGFAYPGSDTHKLSDSPVLLGNTNYDDEILEVIRFDRLTNSPWHGSKEDIYHIQITNGMEDTDFGAWSEFIFAPTRRGLPNDADLLSSGFRIIPLGPNTGKRSSANEAAISHPRSLLNMAFQLPFETHFQDEVVTMAKHFIQHVICCVKKYCAELSTSEPTPVVKSTEGPSGLTPAMNSTEANPSTELNMDPNLVYSTNLAYMICQSYRQSSPMCIYANHAGLNMLETTTDNLQSVNVDSLLDGFNNVSLDVVLPTIMQQGYAILPPGYCLSLMNRCVSYEQAVVWVVQAPDGGSVHCLALAFINWSFI